MKKTLITLALALLMSASIATVGCQTSRNDSPSNSSSEQSLNGSSSESPSQGNSSEENSSNQGGNSSEENSSNQEGPSQGGNTSSGNDSSDSGTQPPSPEIYTVYWEIGENDSTSSEVNHGEAPVYPGANDPTKEATQSTKYSFAGWSKTPNGDVVDLTQEQITSEGVTYYAKFTEEPQQYTVTWIEEGSTETQTLDYGSAITKPQDPTKSTQEAYSTTTYEFMGWADADGNIVTDFGTVSEDVTFTAVFANPTSVWNGTIPTLDSSASADSLLEKDADGNYLIQTATDLANLSALASGKNYGDGMSFKMTANMDLSVGKWLPICDDNGTPGNWPLNSGFTFFGNFDGDNHTITYNETNVGCYFALFNNICDRTIKNIHFEGSIVGGNYLACLAVQIWGNMTLENITSNVDFTANTTSDPGYYAFTAGIVSKVNGPNNSFINCSNTGDITAINNLTTIGGLVGQATQAITLTNCSNSGTITGINTADTDYGYSSTYVGNLIGGYQATFAVTWVIDGASTSTNVTAGEKPTLADPTKPDDGEFKYTFAGWSKTENGAICELERVMGEQTYYAKFNKAPYLTITFNVEGTETKVTVLENQTPEFTGTIINKVGYKFAGWSDGTNTYAPDALPKATATVTYTAVYEEAEDVTITWNIDGDPTQELVKYGSTPTHEKPSKTDYIFLGWSTTAEGSLINLSAQIVTESIEYFAIFEKADLKASEFMSLPVRLGSGNGIADTTRARIDFTFKLKAGAKFTFIGTDEQLAQYIWTVNEEVENINSFTANKNNDIDAGWNVSPNATTGGGWEVPKTINSKVYNTQYTIQSEACYPIIVFAKATTNASGNIVSDNSYAFTNADLDLLKSLIKVEGIKATSYENGALTEAEYLNQPVALGSLGWTDTNKRARIMFSVRMAAGTKVTFIGDSSVYDWAVAETGTHNWYEAKNETDERITTKKLDSSWISGTSYTSQIDGAFLVITLKKDSGATFTAADLKTLHSMFTVEGTKRATYDPAVQVDYDIKSINHRGHNYLAPENTLEAYKLSALSGFKYVECDISFTKDGVPVLLHDDTIDRTSNGTGNIADLTLAEARQYDYGSWFSPDYAGVQIPTLEEFLLLCKQYNLHPYLELKGTVTNDQANVIVDLVEECGMKGNVSYISFGTGNLQNILTQDSNARVGRVASNNTTFTITADWLDQQYNILKGTSSTAEIFFDVWYSQGNTGAVTLEHCKTRGYALEVWTADGAVIGKLDPYVSGVSSEYTIAGAYLANKNDKQQAS